MMERSAPICRPLFFFLLIQLGWCLIDTPALAQSSDEERIRELALEGHLWFDLQRTGRLEEAITAQGRDYDPRIELFAIPQNQIDLTKGVLTQNPGY